MWELFTLGSVPYPEMEAGKSLFHKIRDGHRLEMPEYCTTSIYDIMMSCWLKVPNMRPLFSELEEKIGSLLSDDMKNVRNALLFLMLKILSSRFYSRISSTSTCHMKKQTTIYLKTIQTYCSGSMNPLTLQILQRHGRTKTSVLL